MDLRYPQLCVLFLMQNYLQFSAEKAASRCWGCPGKCFCGKSGTRSRSQWAVHELYIQHRKKGQEIQSEKNNCISQEANRTQVQRGPKVFTEGRTNLRKTNRCEEEKSGINWRPEIQWPSPPPLSKGKTSEKGMNLDYRVLFLIKNNS